MKKLAELFGSSSRELKSVRTITVCAMLAAAAIILVNFRIELTNTQRIGFSGIPNQLVAYLFGPAVSCPVSYTHLDVYKRQELLLFKRGRNPMERDSRFNRPYLQEHTAYQLTAIKSKRRQLP